MWGVQVWTGEKLYLRVKLKKPQGLGFCGLLHPQLWDLEGHNPHLPPLPERGPKIITQKMGREGKKIWQRRWPQSQQG